MFLDRLVEKNAALARVAISGHQSGSVRANTFLLDTAAMSANARVIAEQASGLSLSVYYMAKQFGRNPDACRAVVAGGIERAVAVDLQGMEALARHGLAVGHVGHLVQPHRGAEAAVVAVAPEVVTVFSVALARRLGAAAVAAGRVQDVLLRVHGPGDSFYFGHGGGIALAGLEAAAAEIAAFEGLRVVGVTTFPCLLADPATREIRPTHNLATLVEAAERLRAAGYPVNQVNAPGTTSARTLAMLAGAGATHVEPGNALHGTTPLHVVDDSAPEIPAIVFVSEVSHLDGEDAYVLAAGYYADKVLGDYQLEALVGHDESAFERRLRLDVIPDGAISYYAIARDAAAAGVREGDTVVCCFRPQSFVTRARTQAVAGVNGTDPRFLAVYDEEARLVEGCS